MSIALSTESIKAAGVKPANPTTAIAKVPVTWEKWCITGRHKGQKKARAVLKCLQSGHVRGYFSDIVMRPDLVHTDSMYPSFEHLVDPKNHAEAVVEARLINDMKSHLSETEFWRVIEHLFIVGVEKSKITAPFGKRLPKGWSPKRHYGTEPPQQS